MDKPLGALAELNSIVERAQQVLTDYLPPNSGVTEREAISRLLDILDGPEQRRAQRKAERLLGENPIFFQNG